MRPRYGDLVTPSATDPIAAAKDALTRARLGDFRAAERLLSEPKPADPVASAWRDALAALVWSAAPDLAELPAPPEGDEEARAIVIAEGVRARLLRFEFDPEAAAPQGQSPRSADLAEEHRGLLELVRGDADDALERFEALRRRTKDPSRVVDAATWAALSALAAGDVPQALGRARRASRMARTESLLASEYLASTVLARVRRHAGAPHLAARILDQLRAVVPSPWRPWVRYELALAGAAVEDEGAAGAAHRCFAAARAGDRSAFRQAAEAWDAAVRAISPLRDETGAIVEALDPDVAATSPFATGTSPISPHGVVDPHEADGPAAYVLIRPGGEARRLLAAGRSLVEADRWEPSNVSPKEQRTLALLSVLAFAPSMELEDAFHAVYGFRFTSAKHDAVIRTLLHRTRAMLGDAGTIERSGSTLALRAATTLLLPDPRCARPADQRVLAALAAGHGDLGAKALAKSLRVPLRTVQLALKRLVDDGAARAQRDGRQVAYVVEDSAFCEPTLSRLARRPSGTAQGA